MTQPSAGEALAKALAGCSPPSPLAAQRSDMRLRKRVRERVEAHRRELLGLPEPLAKNAYAEPSPRERQDLAKAALIAAGNVGPAWLARKLANFERQARREEIGLALSDAIAKAKAMIRVPA